MSPEEQVLVDAVAETRKAVFAQARYIDLSTSRFTAVMDDFEEAVRDHQRGLMVARHYD